jgi:hypothetical protein
MPRLAKPIIGIQSFPVIAATGEGRQKRSCHTGSRFSRPGGRSPRIFGPGTHKHYGSIAVSLLQAHSPRQRVLVSGVSAKTFYSQFNHSRKNQPNLALAQKQKTAGSFHLATRLFKGGQMFFVNYFNAHVLPR